MRRLVGELKKAGLSRVNVSLDSLDGERFAEITRGGNLEATLGGIEAALEAGLRPVKLNAVLRRSAWRRDVPALMDFAASKGLEIRFIELMRTGTEHTWCEGEYLAAEEVEAWLADCGTVEPTFNSQAGPARSSLARWNGSLVQLGWITPRSHPFCHECSRLRMDCRGRVYRCLMDNESLGYADLLRMMDETTAWTVLRDYLCGKHPPLAMDRDFSMASIGG
ncbi:MAG TPA: radical SAM protein [Terracidiphilus sp.]|nr:radical SAM protein [Terracidiphilus sp.]